MFEIRFIGLITQATFNDSTGQARQAAILYNVPHMHHRPLLSIRPTEWEPGSSTATPIKSPSARCFKLSGVVTTDLPGGAVTVNLADVPHLPDLCDGSVLNDEILTLSPSVQVNAIVILPAGSLTVDDYFELKGSFSGGPPTCIPRTILFNTPAGSNVTVTIAGKTVVLHPNARAFITNLPMPGAMDMPH